MVLVVPIILGTDRQDWSSGCLKRNKRHEVHVVGNKRRDFCKRELLRKRSSEKEDQKRTENKISPEYTLC